MGDGRVSQNDIASLDNLQNQAANKMSSEATQPRPSRGRAGYNGVAPAAVRAAGGDSSQGKPSQPGDIHQQWQQHVQQEQHTIDQRNQQWSNTTQQAERQIGGNQPGRATMKDAYTGDKTNIIEYGKYDADLLNKNTAKRYGEGQNQNIFERGATTAVTFVGEVAAFGGARMAAAPAVGKFARTVEHNNALNTESKTYKAAHAYTEHFDLSNSRQAKDITTPAYTEKGKELETILDKHREAGSHLTSPEQAEALKANTTKRGFIQQILEERAHGVAPNKLEKSYDQLISNYVKKHPEGSPAGLTAEELKKVREFAQASSKDASVVAQIQDAKYLGKWLEFKKGAFRGGVAVAGSHLLDAAAEAGLDKIAPSHSQDWNRIFKHTVDEDIATGVANAWTGKFKYRLPAMAAGWLYGRNANMTTGEAAVTDATVIGGSFLAAGGGPMLTGLLKKTGTFAEEAKSAHSFKYAVAVAGIEALGAAAGYLKGHILTSPGMTIKHAEDANNNAWTAVEDDQKKKTNSSLENAIDAFRDYGKKFPGGLSTYAETLLNKFPVVPKSDEANPNWGKYIANARTQLVVAESLGLNTLHDGLTHDQVQTIYGLERGSDLKFLHAYNGGNEIVAPNEKADVGARAMRYMLYADQFASFAIQDMQKQQAAQKQKDSQKGMWDRFTGLFSSDPNEVTDSQINALKEHKAQIEKVIHEQILRDGPGDHAHDIDSVINAKHSDGTSYSLSEWALREASGPYSHTVDALEDSAVKAANSYLPKMEQSADPELRDLAQKYVGKLFRDAAMMRLGWVAYQLNSNNTDIENTKIYISGSQVQSGHDAWRNVDSMIAAAKQFDPNNPDLKEVEKQRQKMIDALAAKDPNKDDWYNWIRNPFNIPKPPGIP